MGKEFHRIIMKPQNGIGWQQNKEMIGPRMPWVTCITMGRVSYRTMAKQLGGID